MTATALPVVRCVLCSLELTDDDDLVRVPHGWTGQANVAHRHCPPVGSRPCQACDGEGMVGRSRVGVADPTDDWTSCTSCNETGLVPADDDPDEVCGLCGTARSQPGHTACRRCA